MNKFQNIKILLNTTEEYKKMFGSQIMTVLNEALMIASESVENVEISESQ